MIPSKSDPKWRMLVLGSEIPELSALPTKMLMMRIRLLAKDRTPQKIEEAIDIAYDFFSKNAAIVKTDIEILFGAKK